MTPNIIDFRGKLPTNGAFPQRALSDITIAAVHYQGADTDHNVDILALLRQDAQFHIDKNWCSGGQVCHGYGIEYQYAADDDGIYQLEDETAVTWNDTNANNITLALVCPRVGPNTPPGPKTLANVKAWLDWVTTGRPDLPNLTRSGCYGHGELVEYGNATSCPGGPLLSFVQDYRASNASVVVAPSREDQVVTVLSVIGDCTYKVPVNLVQIQVLVQQGKALFGA